MPDEITLNSPLDMHVHFRQNQMLSLVAPLTAQHFAGALLMPNTTPAITTADLLLDYKRQVGEAVNGYSDFRPYYTLYFQADFTREFLESVRDEILAVKLYPKGITTNSEHGVDVEDRNVERVIGYLEELGIPLCVHGETKGHVMRREREFLMTYEIWAKRFPKLKLVMEHISTKELVTFLGWHESVFATVTPQHILFTTDDFCGNLLRPHLFCKPLLKYPEDREVVRSLALGLYGHLKHKVMLGTDSAPHPVTKKECDCGCAGVFNAPVALAALAGEFADRPEQFQAFVSNNARAIYGIEPPTTRVTMERRPWQVPRLYGEVVPMLAGETLEWSVVAVE